MTSMLPPARVVFVAMRLGRGLNDRAHWSKRARIAKEQRDGVGWALRASVRDRPNPPLTVRLTRCSPGVRPLDGDNLQGSLKAVRDAVAEWVRIDDGSALIVWEYAQRRQATWGVEITLIERPAVGRVPQEDLDG